MKRVILAFTPLIILLTMIGADMRSTDTLAALPVPTKKHCIGYTILEFGKGIDCNGDTVKLIRINGVQVLKR